MHLITDPQGQYFSLEKVYTNYLGQVNSLLNTLQGIPVAWTPEPPFGSDYRWWKPDYLLVSANLLLSAYASVKGSDPNVDRDLLAFDYGTGITDLGTAYIEGDSGVQETLHDPIQVAAPPSIMGPGEEPSQALRARTFQMVLFRNEQGFYWIQGAPQSLYIEYGALAILADSLRALEEERAAKMGVNPQQKAWIALLQAGASRYGFAAPDGGPGGSSIRSGAFDTNYEPFEQASEAFDSNILVYFVKSISSLVTVEPYWNKSTKIKAVKLAVNPSTFELNGEKRVSIYKTLTRMVEEHYGDDLDTVSFTGSSLTFFLDAAGAPVVKNYLSSGSVASGEDRQESDSFKNMQELLAVIRSNGINYFDERDVKIPRFFYRRSEGNEVKVVPLNRHPRAGMVACRNVAVIEYDMFRLFGYFESFSLEEDSSKPFRFEYNVSFRVERLEYR